MKLFTCFPLYLLACFSVPRWNISCFFLDRCIGCKEEAFQRSEDVKYLESLWTIRTHGTHGILLSKEIHTLFTYARYSLIRFHSVIKSNQIKSMKRLVHLDPLKNVIVSSAKLKRKKVNLSKTRMNFVTHVFLSYFFETRLFFVLG